MDWNLSLASLVAAIALAAPAVAQDLPEDPGAARTVGMFDLFCFSQVPDITAIAAIADGSFDEIQGAERQQYLPTGMSGDVRAWRFSDLGQDYVLTTLRTAPDDAFKADFPDFAESTSYGCSLILPQQDPQADILREMTGLLEREPDESWDQEPLTVNSWSGQTESLMVNVFHYAPEDGRPGGLLSVVTFVKE